MISKLSPKRLFLIDGLGALLSAFLLGVVLVRFQPIFGIPSPTLLLLASIPITFALYDFFSLAIRTNHHALLLQIIALANFAYCLLSLSLAWHHRAEITVWGWGYLIGEITIVLLLAQFEWRFSQRLNSTY